LAKKAEVKAKTAKRNAAKAKTAQTEEVKAVREYTFGVKGKQNDLEQAITIDGQKTTVLVGSEVKAQLSQLLDVPEVIRDIFEGILAQTTPLKAGLGLGIKAGYGKTQFGVVKAKQGNSWSGYVTYTDGQLCWHSWPQRAITVDDLAKIRQANELPLNRSGKNWMTISFTKNNVKACVQACLDVIKLV